MMSVSIKYFFFKIWKYLRSQFLQIFIKGRVLKFELYIFCKQIHKISLSISKNIFVNEIKMNIYIHSYYY
jgi:hypothetical protein